ncbi:helix-turn-helix transcriptional regulator [Microbacterium maritypicum]
MNDTDRKASPSAEDFVVLYEGLQDSAAFMASWDAFELLREATNARSDLRQADVAARLGVSKGRVSQALAGRGNPSVSTLARYLRVLGYELKLSAVPVEPGAPPMEQKPTYG